MQEISYPQGTPAVLPTSRIAWNTAIAVVLSTALLAICAHIAVPLGFTPVPVTMQTFAVLLLGLLFAPGPAFACMALYLVEGAVGLPVFSPPGPGGLAQLLGPSGGYLLAYPFAATLASWLYRRGKRGFLVAIAASGLASILILAIGAGWLGFLSHAKLSVVFFQSIAPFLPGDAIKVLAAAGCASLLGSFGDASRNQAR
jgi:biotin transport system substrate-specific component